MKVMRKLSFDAEKPKRASESRTDFFKLGLMNDLRDVRSLSLAGSIWHKWRILCFL